DGGADRMREVACRIADRVMNRVIDRSEQIVARTAGSADHILSRARLTVHEDQSSPCRYMPMTQTLQAKLDRQRDAEIARVNVFTARQEANLARIEAQRDRVQAVLANVEIPNVDVHVASCPRVRVHVPRIPEMHVQVPNMRISVPQVHIENSMSDPI